MKGDIHLAAVALVLVAAILSVMPSAEGTWRDVNRRDESFFPATFDDVFHRNVRFESRSPDEDFLAARDSAKPSDVVIVDSMSAPLRQTLAALRHLLAYLLRHTDDLNLDAGLGTRIVEGQLKVLLGKMKRSSDRHFQSNPSPQLKQEVASLARLAKDTTDITAVNLLVKSDQNYAVIGRLLAPGFWEFDYPTRETNPDYVYPVVFAEEAMNESKSDQCLAELSGSGPHGKECVISDSCWDLMTRPQYSRYSLTHQIIYLLVGESMKCNKGMDEKIVKFKQRSTGHLQEIFCANVIREIKEHAAKEFPSEQQDLFMEQAAICGILGYRDPFRISWLNRILSWQLPQGCYGQIAKKGQLISNKRAKREEKQLADGCLAHRSAVAAAALAQYVRYLLENPEL